MATRPPGPDCNAIQVKGDHNGRDDASKKRRREDNDGSSGWTCIQTCKAQRFPAVVLTRANPRMWNHSRKELSMEKLYKRIQERAFTLLALMLSSMTQATAYLAKELQHIARHCLKCTQPSRPTTLEVLDRSGLLDVEVLTISPLS